MCHKFGLIHSEKAFGIDLEIKQKSSSSVGNRCHHCGSHHGSHWSTRLGPVNSEYPEGVKLIGRVKYQPQIQFLEGVKLTGGVKQLDNYIMINHGLAPPEGGCVERLREWCRLRDLSTQPFAMLN